MNSSVKYNHKAIRRAKVLPLLDDTGFEAFKARKGRCARKGLIISMPKAGTYLVAKMLENLGLVDLEIHLAQFSLSDYREMSREEKLGKARILTRYIAAPRAAEMILPGQFAESHMPFEPQVTEAFKDFCKLVLIRDPRKALVSYMRFDTVRIGLDPLFSGEEWATLPDGPSRMRSFIEARGAFYLEQIPNLLTWRNEPNAIVCSFESLVGELGEREQRRAAGSIASAFGFSVGRGLKALDAALGKATLTYSGERSSLDKYWDASVEEVFLAAGGLEATRLLGACEPKPVGNDNDAAAGGDRSARPRRRRSVVERAPVSRGLGSERSAGTREMAVPA